MAKKTKYEILAVNPATDNIPECGLGEFVNGFTDTHINYKIQLFTIILGCITALLAIINVFTKSELLIFLTIIIGAVFLIMLIVDFYRIKIKKRISVFLYKDGFLWLVQSSNGSVINKETINYSDVFGINLSSTKQYTNGVYNCTNCTLKIMSNNQRVFFNKNGLHKSQLNDPIQFETATMLGMYFINLQWGKRNLEQTIIQFNQEGKAVFLTSEFGDAIIVTQDTLSLGDKQIDMKLGFDYKFDNGQLIIKQKTDEKKLFGKTKIVININGMFNQSAFLYLIKNLFGIK
ncbi:MAG: hypothetical protein J6X58_00010 [Bacteroidales bacterium]|nr:hypothetical protein [Bacteroidales bacterium]